MEVRAQARYVRVSPRKARIVVDLVRGKSVAQAQEILRFTNRGIAETARIRKRTSHITIVVAPREEA